jgi:myo-inositol 2-dehydrogenase/D-chiro-inositol 1-dehydrogenase
MLQLGIIGCGRVTTMFHLKAINMLDNIKIVALSDVNEYRLRNAARKTDTKLLFTDYRDLINDPNITAVVINTPPEFHTGHAFHFLKHLLPFLSEILEVC